MGTEEIYRNWLDSTLIDTATKAELQSIATNPLEIEDRFYKQLEFGTGGIRGILGAGTNRINPYTIRRVTKGLAHYIHSFGTPACKRGVVIAYDSRHQSRELAIEAAHTLLAHDIKAYVFEEPTPTPLLSFSVRKLNTIAGIVITASHNPPEYNGYKVYWDDGGQIVPDCAEKIAQAIETVEDIPSSSDQNNDITWLREELAEEYIARLLSTQSQARQTTPLKVVYTPLHGTGGKIVKQLLRKAGFAHAVIVPEQEHPDATFPTVSLPNPEAREAFDRAVLLGESMDADLILASDPDCDRVGVLVKSNDGYIHLTGNQVGAILLHYLLPLKKEKGCLPENGVIIKTIVTSNLGPKIAEKHNIPTIETLTGFKYIGEKIREFEYSGEKTFLFGYEESCGYLSETFVRDKDGIMTILLLCELASYYKEKGRNLSAVLEDIYEEHGYFLETLESRTFKGKEGMSTMKQIIESWRNDPPRQLHAFKIHKMCDYLQQECVDVTTSTTFQPTLPKENALHFTCTDGSWFCIRPSGTEPKLKVYVGVRGESQYAANQKLELLVNEIMRSIDHIHK